MNPLYRFGLAVSYVTCIPVCRLPADQEAGELHGLSKYLPAVGLLIGALLLTIALGLRALQTNQLTAGAVLALSWLVITGGIHLDGLMDTADGVFSHREQERMLEIMADSRVGNFGAMTGFAVLIVKFASLSSLPFPALLPVLLLVPAWARWCETYAIAAFPYLREAGMGKVWHQTTRHPLDPLLAGMLPVLATAAVWALGFRLSPLPAGFTILSGMGSAFYLVNILRGHTGDTYGAVVELAEAAALLLTALTINLPAIQQAILAH